MLEYKQKPHFMGGNTTFLLAKCYKMFYHVVRFMGIWAYGGIGRRASFRY